MLVPLISHDIMKNTAGNIFYRNRPRVIMKEVCDDWGYTGREITVGEE